MSISCNTTRVIALMFAVTLDILVIVLQHTDVENILQA